MFGNLTIRGCITALSSSIISNEIIAQTVYFKDALINLAPTIPNMTQDGIQADATNYAKYLNIGIFSNLSEPSTSTNTQTTLFSGLIRKKENLPGSDDSSDKMGTSYWYLFDSNGTDSEQQLCPNLTTDRSVGAILQVGTVLCTSDERLKVNIETIENTLESISNLRGVRYDWKDGHGRKEIGVIAQDIEKEYPELIHKDDSGYLTVDYPKLSGVLIEGIKCLNKKIDYLESRLEKLEEKPKRKIKPKKE